MKFYEAVFLDGFLFSFAQQNIVYGIQAGDDGGFGAGLDAIAEVGDLTGVAIGAIAGEDLWCFTFDEELVGFFATRKVEVGGGTLEVHCVGLVEAEAIGKSPRTFGMDHHATIIGVLREDVINRTAQAGVARGVNALGGTEAPLHEVHIVDVEIKQRTAGFGAFEEVMLTPAGRLGDAAESCPENFAVDAAIDGLLQPGPTGPPTGAHRGEENTIGVLCGGPNLAGLRRLAREGFFTQDVLAGFQCRDGLFWMSQSRGADVDGVDVWIREHFGEVAVGADLRHVEFERFLGADISGDVGEVTVETASTGTAQGGDANAFYLAIRFDVRGGHEAEPDDADVDHGRIFNHRWTRMNTDKFKGVLI